MCKISESDFQLICEVLEIVASECNQAGNAAVHTSSSYANWDYSKRCNDVLERFKSAYKER